VFYFMPGLRYFRAVEDLIFGDSNLFYVLYLLFVPIIVFCLIRELTSETFGFILSLFFILNPFDFSFFHYVRNAYWGYAESLGYGFFLLAFLSYMRYEKAEFRNLGNICIFRFSFLMFLAVFFRPNLLIVTSIVWGRVVYGLWRNGSREKILPACMGCGLISCMLFHNLIFGQKFVLLTASADITKKVSIHTYVNLLGSVNEFCEK
jgi:hypothetical protein